MDEFVHLVEALRLDLGAKLLIAVIAGGGIGLEREFARKPAGLRTNILICLGATLLMDLSIGITSGNAGDPGRIAAQVVTGVGFLGAGTILHTRGTITGLTSAATIWVVAAIGLTVGAGAVLRGAGVDRDGDASASRTRLGREALFPVRARQPRWCALERVGEARGGATRRRSRDGARGRTLARSGAARLKPGA